MTGEPQPSAKRPAIYLPYLIAGPIGALLTTLFLVPSFPGQKPALMFFTFYLAFGLPALVFAFLHVATFDATGEHRAFRVLGPALALGLLCVPLLQIIGFAKYPTFAEAIYTNDFSQIFRLGLPATALAGYLAVLALAPTPEKPPLPPASE